MDEHELHHGWLLALLCSATAGPKSAFADRPSNLNNLKKKKQRKETFMPSLLAWTKAQTTDLEYKTTIPIPPLKTGCTPIYLICPLHFE
jgi:hypothetical protein